MLLTTTFPNGMFSIGSGVMVGRNDVLTAAHVIYEPAWGGFASQVVATPAAVVGPPFQAPYSASFARITAADTQFDPNGDRLIEAGNRGPGYVGSERDIAFLTLDIPLGDRTGWMALDPGFKQGYANLSGYPAVHRHALTNDTAWAYDDAVDAFTNLFYFEAHPGNSGGPVWHYGSDGRPAVVGIVSSANNGRGLAALDIAPYHPSILSWSASNDHLIA